MQNCISKTNRIIGLITGFKKLLPRSALTTIYKTFVRPHLDNGDNIFEYAFNAAFHETF